MAQEEAVEEGRPPNRLAWRTRLGARLQRYKVLLASKWWILLLGLLGGAGYQGWTWSKIQPYYVSTGQMIVNVRLAIPEGSLYTEELSNFLGTQSALMQSGVVINRAHARVLARFTNSPLQSISLRATVLPKTTIFTLQATGPEADYTQAFLQAVMEEYVQLKREMLEDTSDTTLAGITEEVLRLERELKKAEEELSAFQGSNSVVLLEEQGSSAVSYLGSLKQRLAGLRSEHDLLQNLTLEQSLKRQQPDATEFSTTGEIMASSSSSGGTRPAMADYFRARQEIALLKAEERDLGEYLRPKHPKMIVLAENIARRERALEIVREQTAEQLESLKGSLAVQIKGLEKDVHQWEAESLEVSRKNAEFQRLKGNAQRIQTLYERLLGTMQTLDVNKGISPETVTIMEKASVARPSRPELQSMLLKGALIGLALGVGFLWLLDRLDDRLTSASEVQELFDEAVLAQIPREKMAHKHLGKPLVCVEGKHHSFVEAYRNLRSSLLYMSLSGQMPKCLLITSSVPGEGKSLNAANLAAMLATAGSRVLLVDADLRKGLMHDEFGLEAEPGLSDLLARGVPFAQTVQSTVVPNLWLLPRGAATHEGSELFVSQATETFLKEAAAQYDYVILDTAPVMAVDDVSSLAPHVECSLFVIRAEQTSARVARTALDLLYRRRVRVLGLIFNAVRPTATDYYYYKYRDYYATYPGGSRKSRRRKRGKGEASTKS